MKDESGLIDLHALMAAARSREYGERTTPEPVVQHIAVYPLGAPVEQVAPPAPGPDPEVAAPGRFSRWSRVLPVIGGLAVAGAVAVVLLARGPGDGGPRTGTAGVSGEVINSSAESVRVAASPLGESAPPAGPGSAEQRAVTAKDPSPDAVAVPAPEPRPISQKAPVTPKKVDPKPVDPKKVEPKPVDPKKVDAKPVDPKKVKTPPPDPCKGDLMCAMQRSVGKK